MDSFVGAGFPNPKRTPIAVIEVSYLADAACQSNSKIYYILPVWKPIFNTNPCCPSVGSLVA